MKDILEAMRQAHERGEAERVFELAVAAKADGQRFLDLDYYRALAFLALDRKDEASFSLKEELRFFPDNARAAALLAALPDSGPKIPPEAVRDPDYLAIFEKIRGQTMLSEARLHTLYDLARRVCNGGVPGNFVECGVSAGGSSALLGLAMKRLSRAPRRLFCLDTFSGMPEACLKLDRHEDVPALETGWGQGTCAASQEHVNALFDSLGLSDAAVIVKGLFQDTLPAVKGQIGAIALLHLDGDWYESTMIVLRQLFPAISPGGFIQIDDYGHWEGCRRAVEDYQRQAGIKLHLERIDDTGVYAAVTDGSRP